MSETITLPPGTDARWQNVATGKISRPWSALGMKIMMMRIQREIATDSSAPNVQKCANEIHIFFQKNWKLAQDDLAAILH
jgi:hypothetical protein